MLVVTRRNKYCIYIKSQACVFARFHCQMRQNDACYLCHFLSSFIHPAIKSWCLLIGPICVSQVVKCNMIENIIPIMIAVKHKLEEQRSPLTKHLLLFFKEIMKDYKNEVRRNVCQYLVKHCNILIPFPSLFYPTTCSSQVAYFPLHIL